MNKLLFIIVIIAGILILGFILLLSLFGPKKTPESVKPVIQASFTPSPATTFPTNTNILKIVSISPAENINQVYLPIKQVFFTFNKAMNPATFIAEASPAAKIVVTLKAGDPTIVTVSPQEKWQPGITTITIQNTTTSADNSRLDQPIIYKINTKFPENPPPDSPGL